ncbi:hypothetical protein R8Z50_26825 [Longispora sp. K20-0274]|uniref:hypothetical protein n=1 Tax=Longispora sp. K20-0274 TaxID=3088255 RepID=UPI00399B5ECB
MTTDQEPVSDDIAHALQAIGGFSTPSGQQMTESVNLLGQLLAQIPSTAWDDTFVNDFSARACLTRSYRQLRAAITLLTYGYYGEALATLREVYESAGLARVLAKDAKMAEQWIKKGQWFPDSKVRGWIADAWDLSEDKAGIYGQHYKRMSAWAHPTASSSMHLVTFGEAGPSFRTETVYDATFFGLCMKEIAATAVFACFAVRNAAANEALIDPAWRKQLHELTEKISGEELEHLQRDWDAEERRFEALVERVRPEAELDDHLREHPLSWENLKPKE